MGQIFVPGSPGIVVNPLDRESGPGAGAGASGNYDIFLGQTAGNNSTVNKFIVLGNGALAGGATPQIIGGGAVPDGGTIVGAGAAAALTGINVSIVIGTGAFATTTFSQNNVSIGENNFAAATGNFAQGAPSRITALGNNILARVAGIVAGPTQNCVFIGDGIGNDPGGINNVQLTDSVIIGSKAASNCNTWPNSVGGSNTVVGSGAFQTAVGASPSGNVVIGQGAAGAVSGFVTNNVFIGTGAGKSFSAPNPGYNVAIGTTCTSGQDHNVFIGDSIAQNLWNTSTYCIALGNQAGQGLNSPNYILLFETFDGATKRTALYADMNAGNVVLGNSTIGTNRDFGGAAAANVVKLINGTKGAANPIGGGYFYVSAGALHWVDSGGVDNLLSIGTAGQLAASSIAYTNNAGAQIATITNGPTAGNPTKWIPINDNGTIRNVPAW